MKKIYLKYCLLFLAFCFLGQGVFAQCVATATGVAEPGCGGTGTISTAAGGKQVYTVPTVNGAYYTVSISGGSGYTTNPTTISATGTTASISVYYGGGCTWFSGNGSATLTYTRPAVSCSISGGTSPVCYGTSPGTYTATGSGGSGSGYTYQWTLDGTNVSTAATYNPGTAIAAGSHNVVCTATNSVCSGTSSTSSFTVIATPTATIATSSTTACQGGTAPTVTITNTSGASATINYTLGGVAQTAVTLAAGATYNPTVSTATATTLTYALTSVAYSSGTACTATLSSSVSIVVSPTPTATITTSSTTACLGGTAPTVTIKNTSAVTASVAYTLGGVAQTPQTLAAGATYTPTVSTATATTLTYALTSVTYTGTPSCSATLSSSVSIVVSPTPTATITSSSTTACQNGTAPTVTITNTSAVSETVSYTLGGTAQTPVTLAAGATYNPTVSTATATTLTYALTNATYTGTPTCSATLSASVSIVVSPTPTATITTGATSVCQGATSPTVTITNTSASNATISYSIDGTAQTPIALAAGATSTISPSTASAHTFTYALTSIQYTSGTACPTPLSSSVTVTVVATPTATITTSATSVCQGATAPTVTITNTSSASATISYSLGGSAQTPVTLAAGGTYTPTVSTATATTLTYALTNIAYSSGTTCPTTLSASVSIVVVPTPTATITTSGTSVCQGGTAPTVTIKNTAASSATVSYSLNGTAQTPVTLAAGGTYTPTVSTATATTLTYALTGIQYSSGTTCPTTLSASVSIVVTPTPTATITTSATSVCQGGTAPTVTITNTSSSSATVSYSLGGSAQTPVTLAAGATYTPTVSTATATTLTYQLTSISYSSGSACTASLSASVSITVIATPSVTISASPTGLCQNGGNATITFINFSYAQVTVDYKINGTAQTPLTINALSSTNVTQGSTSSGSFVYTLTDAYYTTAPSCTTTLSGTATVTVTAQPTSVTLSDDVATNGCNGGHTVTVTAVGGTSPYNFSLNGTAYTNEPSPFQLNPVTNITYTLSAFTDHNGCSAATTIVSSINPGTSTTLTAGDSLSCAVAAGATQLYYDRVGKLMAQVKSTGASLGATKVVTYVDASVQNSGGPVHPQSYLQRHYRITPATNSAAVVSLFLTDAEADSLSSTSGRDDNHGAPSYYAQFASNLSNAAITKYDGNSEAPMDNTSRMVITGLTTTHNPTINGLTYNNVYQVSFTVTTFSGFYIYAGNLNNNSLPVTMLYLTADAINNKFIELDWATASEINNKGFNIERSTDGITFTTIAFIQGNGNSNSKILYEYDDKTAQPGTTYYYRLQQVDIDGNTQYSEIVSASLTGDKTFSFEDLIPNPASNSVQLGILSNVGQKTTVIMTDMLGRVVLDNPWQLSEGYNISTFDISRLAAGTYNVTVYTGDGIYTTKRLVVTK